MLLSQSMADKDGAYVYTLFIPAYLERFFPLYARLVAAAVGKGNFLLVLSRESNLQNPVS